MLDKEELKDCFMIDIDFKGYVWYIFAILFFTSKTGYF